MTSAHKQPSMLTGQVVRDGLRYWLRGGLSLHNAHLPLPNHIIPADFIGVCVASQADPMVDDYVIAQLKQLGIQRVRLDFTYGDIESFNARFLRALIAAGFKVNLHLVQPFSAAKDMLLATEQAIWQQFLDLVLDTFGQQVAHIEIGNTINRKRWSGYTPDSFLVAWQIAFDAIRARKLTLVGPNIQDFEPVYNISLLKTLKARQQLPDMVSNNLFCERVPEPESFDHRVFKYQWTTCFKYNLVKKARLLQKVAKDFGVPRLVSPVAFWAMYRLQRRLAESAQKQADYAARYFLLLASSGALQQANWGALICQREGLIDNGLADVAYPDLERVAHYAQADGAVAQYQTRPSFGAVKTVAHMIQGATYVAALSTANGVELHHFCKDGLHIHAAWSQNGKVAYLADLYTPAQLASAKLVNRDGAALTRNQALITESPIYLIWDSPVKLTSKPKLVKDLTIHAHIPNLHYFVMQQDGWQGMIVAKDADEAALLMRSLHPDSLHAPQKSGTLRHARNAIWAVSDPRDAQRQLTVKQPIKMYPHKALLDRFKPSKAKRSWSGAMALMRRGIGTAAPVAYFEKIGDHTLKQNFYVCEFVPADCSIGQIFSAFASGETSYLGLPAEDIYRQFARFCNELHGSLIYFRDFSGGNILVNRLANNTLAFSLIDTARLRSFELTPFPLKYRLADLTRACHKLHWAGRERFMQLYFGMDGRKFTWQHRLSFYLYDIKVSLKRTIGRKGWRRLVNHLKAK